MEKKFYFRGLEVEEVKKMSMEEFMKLIPSRSRRTLKRGLNENKKKLLADIAKNRNNERVKIKTHCRDMVIIPEMLDTIVAVYNGKEFVDVHINHEKLGHVLGEFAPSRKSIKHNAPGIGATKSTSSASVK